MKRKILFAILLALCVSLIPAAVFADELLIAPAEAADGAAEDVDTEALPGIDQSDLIDYLDQLINPGPEPRILIWDSSSVYVMGNEGWEYVIAEKGEEPDWTQAVQPEEGGGVYFEGLKAAAEYVVYTRAVKTDEPSGGVIYQSSVMTSIDSVGIMGEAVVGKTLTAEVEPQGIEGLEIRWCYDDITEVEEYVYNHERTPIEGASGLSYVPTEADLGKYLSVVICKGDTELTTVDEIGPVIPGYEVYFLIDAADEEPFEVMYAGEDGRLESLPVPEKEGFTFEGWHGWEGESVTEETVFEWSSTVFAWWTDPEGKVSGGPVLTPELSFEDVAEDDYFYGPVVWAVENGVTEGTSDTTFSPYKDCTRAQMVTFLWRTAGCPRTDLTTMFFDVDPDAYYVEALSWAFNNGIVEGVEPHTFAPNKTVTRGQAVTMLYRYAKASAQGSCPFTDVAEGAYCYEPVIWAYDSGITEGTSATAFSPAKPCTRAQIVTFLHRLALSGGMPEPEEPQSQIPEDLGLIHEPEFGGIYLTKTIDEFNAMGFSYGDSVDIYFSSGYILRDIPYYNGYYTDNGQPLLVAYPGYDYIKACINNGADLWEVAGIEDGDMAAIVLNEAGKYLDIQNARDIRYTDERADYGSDEIFANFRALSGGDLSEGPATAYRSASPCDDQHNRASYVDKLMGEKGVKYIIDLADTDEKIANYMAAEGFDSPNFKALYEAGKVIPVGLNTNFQSDEFRSKVVSAMNAIVDNEGPFLIHCTEGKDRTGFVCMLIEALEGASYEEIVNDYMITYDNYYGITEESDGERYDVIVEKVLEPMMRELAGDEEDLKLVDFTAPAARWLEAAGMEEDKVVALSAKLGGRQE